MKEGRWLPEHRWPVGEDLGLVAQLVGMVAPGATVHHRGDDVVLGTQSITVGSPWQCGQEADSYILYIFKKQREVDAGSQLAFFLFIFNFFKKFSVHGCLVCTCVCEQLCAWCLWRSKRVLESRSKSYR